MAADGIPERVLVGSSAEGYRADDLAARAGRIGGWLASQPGERLALVDLNSEAVPLALFGAALAGKPFVPINYRLADEQLRALIQRTAPAVVVVGEGVADRIGPVEGISFVGRDDFIAISADESYQAGDPYSGDPDSIAVLLYTSGTTGEPKAAVLRHRNLAAYILSTVEFGSADPDEAGLVSVPPYHIAGMSAVLSSTYAGRRVVYMESFSPEAWVALARNESISHAMVVPTMLHRILDVLEAEGEKLPRLRNLSYGGGPMPVPVIERALTLLPHVNFVNAYGLTETSSTIALLGPEDHRDALASRDPAVRARLGSVGRPLPSVTVSIRDPDEHELPTGERGEIWVQGDQVSGEYLGRGSAGDGWFRTRDAGHLDADGFLFVHGRLDDVIVRGGENLSPGEIEETLVEHPAVDSAAVVGIPDTDWGEKVVAAVTCAAGAAVTEDELKDFVRQRLRSTKTPERIQIREQLPYNETGKLLRRVLRDELAAEFTPA
jgi:acyl-CoA synthetase (AMP-forming)/AMP-acid ligase II